MEPAVSPPLTPPARRFLVVSGYFPPIVGGTSTVVRNLLAAFDPASFAVVAEAPSSLDGRHNAPAPAGIRVRRVGLPRLIRRLPFFTRFARRARFALTPLIRRAILRSARRLRAERLVALYPSWPFLLAAFQAHRITGIPLITYYMDVTDPHPSSHPLDLQAIRHMEEVILKSASRRLVLSEIIAHDLRARYGLDSVVVPHSIDIPAMLQRAAAAPPAIPVPGKEVLLVHTGVVEDLQQESLLRLARALHWHPDLNARLVISTPTSKADLARRGFDLPCVDIRNLDQEEVFALQRQAAIAVAVLPFQSRLTRLQMTAFPTKIVEYMLSGAPILIHAPPESYLVESARHHRYAMLVTEPSEKALAEAIRVMLADREMTRQLVANARATVENVYSLAGVSRLFADACGLDPACRKMNDATPPP
jgi:glycosyltransferase involved in cell wall biosynthesis